MKGQEIALLKRSLILPDFNICSKFGISVLKKILIAIFSNNGVLPTDWSLIDEHIALCSSSNFAWTLQSHSDSVVFKNKQVFTYFIVTFSIFNWLSNCSAQRNVTFRNLLSWLLILLIFLLPILPFLNIFNRSNSFSVLQNNFLNKFVLWSIFLIFMDRLSSFPFSFFHFLGDFRETI